MASALRVKVSAKAVSFPPVCPHCLRPAAVTIGIQSPEEMVGFYIFFSRWKHSTVRVPFCSEFGRRLQTFSTLCYGMFFVLVAVFVVLILAFEIALEGWQAGLSIFGLIIITWIPSFFIRPERYIKLLESTAESIEFSVRDADYARMLERSNGIGPPVKEGPTKDNDDGQAFAA